VGRPRRIGAERPSIDGLHVDGTSPVHRMAAAPKLAGLVAFVLVVALTPGRAVAPFLVDLVLVVALVGIARLPVRLVVARLAAVLPFVAFALLLPFVASGERTSVLGVEFAVDGLWASWSILAKALLGATATIVVTATTPIPELLRGLERLRVPRLLVAIIASMVRYLDLVADQLARSRRAMVARGHDPRWLWQVAPIASSIGSTFVRTYERGERVHLAMAARGFTGTLPTTAPAGAPTGGPAGALALVPAVLAAAVLLVGVAGS
jgi:cobalt/nickel transport system permease protein